MAAGMLMPMVRFAVDPVLQTAEERRFHSDTQKSGDITEEPERVDFTYEQVDAWYKSEVTNTAWVYKDGR